jgi:hypothetical protein
MPGQTPWFLAGGVTRRQRFPQACLGDCDVAIFDGRDRILRRLEDRGQERAACYIATRRRCLTISYRYRGPTV